MFHFDQPEVLWLLVLLPLLAFLRGRRGPASAIRYSSAQTAKAISGARKSRAGKWLGTLRILALGALVVALAQPQIVHGTSEVDASGIDIILAVDVSGSMEALDFTIDNEPANRVDVVKEVVSRFIEERPNDRIGLVAFAGKPYMVSPLTLDHQWLQKRLKTIHPGMVEDGTAIGSAIGSSVNRLRDQKAKSRIVILLTDGMNNAGKILPVTAAEAAETLGIKIYTIGAGSRGEVPVPVTDPYGNKKIVRAKVDIDEKTLKQVARMTGAQYYRATDTHSLERFYGDINKLETLLLMGIEFTLSQTRFRRLP